MKPYLNFYSKAEGCTAQGGQGAEGENSIYLLSAHFSLVCSSTAWGKKLKRENIFFFRLLHACKSNLPLYTPLQWGEVDLSIKFYLWQVYYPVYAISFFPSSFLSWILFFSFSVVIYHIHLLLQAQICPLFHLFILL